MFLSIIIPVYNEQQKIFKQLSSATEYLKSTIRDFEFIIVDDGSTDDTVKEVEDFKKLKPDISVTCLQNEQNKGKGFSIRRGVTAAKGQIICFTDCGDCIPAHYFSKGIDLIKNSEYDIAHGSRRLSKSVIVKEQSLKRKISGMLFRLYINRKFNIPQNLTDTQCGFKFYRCEVAKQLYSDCKCDGFLFDIEIIVNALKKNYKIKEFAIQWKCDNDSRLKLFSTLRSIYKESKLISPLRSSQ